MSQSNSTMKLLAAIVASTFFVTNLQISPNAFAVGSVSTPEASSLTVGSLAIPADLGQVTDTVTGDPKAPAFIHIQSAHGSYQAEKNIEKLLGYIEKNTNVKLMLLEGAANKLHPELFRLFSEHPDFNHKVTDKLMQEGYLTGPESFLIESSKKTEGWGIENLDAYKKDRDAFMSVVRSDKTAQAFLLKLRATIDKRFTTKLNKDLLNFIRQEEAFASGTVSFESWIKILGEGSKKHLEQNLSDAFYQDQYPSLIRFFRMQTIGSKIDRDKARREANVFLNELDSRKVSKDIIENFKSMLQLSETDLLKTVSRTTDGYSTLRRSFDLAFNMLPKDFSMTQWPDWTLYAQYIILMQEMEGNGLHEEALSLQDKIQTALAKTADEKEYLAKVREFYLLRRLFNLELTRKEYEELTRKVKMSEIQEAQPLYKTAMDFYLTAIDRENKMFANAFTRMSLQKQDRVVIVTGGFHGDGLKKLAASKGCSYIQITPRIAEVSKRDHEVYLRSILGNREVETSQMSRLLLAALSATQVAREIMGSIRDAISSEPVSAQPALSAALASSAIGRSEMRLADAKIEAREIKDSRGKSTVQAVITIGYITTTGDVPAGASKGEREARTVSTAQAIENIHQVIAPLIKQSGLDLRKHEDLLELERRIIERAGDNFKDLGANATVPVSWALWKMAAALNGMELDQYIRQFEPDAVYANREPVRFLMNIYNGGLHALKAGETLGVDRIDIQEIMIVPVGPKAATYRGALEMGDKIDAALKKILVGEFGASAVSRADESGFSVKGLGNSSAAIERVFQAIQNAGYEVGTDVQLTVDAAASSFYKDGGYLFQGKKVNASSMVGYYDSLVKQYHGKFRFVEDGLAENDWDGWVELTRQMKQDNIMTIGDDLFVTQLASLGKGIKLGVASDILIKVNQNGTVSGTLAVIKLAKSNGMGVVISHRSGETMSPDIASLAYAVRASALKTGDPQPGYDFSPGGEYAARELVRRAKYSKMIELEERDVQLARSEMRLTDAKIEAREIKDSRGKSTVQAVITIGDITTTGDVPAGASKGEREARTVSTAQAIENIHQVIAPLIKQSGLDLRKHEDLLELERRIIERAGDNFKDLGANATVPVSWALWKMAAALNGMELDQYIRQFEPDAVYANREPVRFLMNIYNGGLHALKAGETLGVDRIDIQEIMIVPVGPKAATYRGALEMGDKIDAALKKILVGEFGASAVSRADESGFSVKGLGNSSAAIERVFQAIQNAGYEVGTDVQLTVDAAASSFYKDGGYLFQGKKVNASSMVGYYDSLVKQYHGKFRFVEDGLAENDWDGWVELTRQMKQDNIMTIGDDLFVTQLASLGKGIKLGVASDILIKVNQNGTVSGTLAVIKLAKSNGMGVVISHRSGETMSPDIASLAYAVRASALKTGDPQPGYDFSPGGEYAARELVRRAKYSKMIELEERDVQLARSEARFKPLVSMVDTTSSMRTKIRVALGVAAETISPLFSSSTAFAGEIKSQLFAGTSHYQKIPVVPAIFSRKWPVFSKIISRFATASTERMVIDQRQGVPDAASVLPLVTFALYNPKVAVVLALVADAAEVAAFEKELSVISHRGSLPQNFVVRAFANENEFVGAFATFYNSAAPLGQSVALITDREDSVVTQKIGSRRHLLSVVGAQNPLKQTASTLLAADKLLNESIWSMGYRFVSVEKLGGLEVLMAELTSYVAAQAKVLASA